MKFIRFFAATVLWIASALMPTQAANNYFGPAPALAQFFQNWQLAGYTGIIRIFSFGDSLTMCKQSLVCAAGPNRYSVMDIIAQELILEGYPQYSTGLIPISSNVGLNTLSSGNGFTLTSGSLSQGTFAIGPQQTGMAQNGIATLQASSGAVITYNPGRPWTKIIVYCGTNATSNGWTPTVNSIAQSNICTAQPPGAAATVWSITSNILTVTTVGSGTFNAGGMLSIASGSALTAGTSIISQLTGSAGAAGTYQLSQASTASNAASGNLTETAATANAATISNAALTTATSASWSQTGNVLTITTLTSGTFGTGGTLSGTGVPVGETITYQMTGTVGGAGTYLVSGSATASSGTITQTGGLVNLSFTLTALGANSFIYGTEAVVTTGNFGFAVDNMGVGGSTAAWFASGTATGTSGIGLAWANILPGTTALCIHSNGVNDSFGTALTGAQNLAQNQIVVNLCEYRQASVLFWIESTWSADPATYQFTRQAQLNYAIQQQWDVMLMDEYAPAINAAAGAPNFVSLNTLTPAVGSGVQNNDGLHSSDCGAATLAAQFMQHVFGRQTAWPFSIAGCGAVLPAPTITSYTNATTGFTTVNGATGTFSGLVGYAPASQTLNGYCEGWMQVSATATVLFQITGPASPTNVFYALEYQTASASAPAWLAPVTAFASALTTASITVTATNLYFRIPVTIVNGTTGGQISVQAHPSTGTLTIQPGAACHWSIV